MVPLVLMAEKRAMTEEHKAALAEGRRQGRAVRTYLEALEQHSPSGAEAHPESIRKQLDTIDAEIDEADPVKKLQLIQDRMDLEDELGIDREQGRPRARSSRTSWRRPSRYSERKCISYAAWRELGVEASVLKRAGITRGS